jgi:hypothetical protein
MKTKCTAKKEGATQAGVVVDIYEYKVHSGRGKWEAGKPAVVVEISENKAQTKLPAGKQV